MNINLNNSIVPHRLQPRGIRLNATRVRHVLAQVGSGSAAALTTFMIAGHAFAQTATPSTAGIGAQVQNISQESSTTAGFAFSAACYGGALAIFFLSAWTIYSSYQPQNRESGRRFAGFAGLLLTGLVATGPQWIGKSANTASGGNATITSTAGTVTFGNGN